METQSPPSKIPRISGKAGNGQGNGNGIGSRRSGGFTLMQLLELQQQAQIYKYMEAGIPIPFHLIMPIWKSVRSSLSICQLNHPNLLGYGPLSLCTIGLEPEPERCRRTDGKKWRCSRSVVSGDKYCQRHMHRHHQQHSRKLAEMLANGNST